MAYRHQARMSTRLISHPGHWSRTFLYKRHEICDGPTVQLYNMSYAYLSDNYIKESERTTHIIMGTPKVI